MTKTTVALIGAGFIAESHAAALGRISGVTITGVVDPALPRAEAMARRYGGKAFPSIEALLAEAKPDIAHVLTPPPAHRRSAEPLLRAGVDVLLEKPMAETPEDCAALRAAAREGGARLRINHNYVYHPAHLELKALVASGEYGKVRRVQTRFASPLRQLLAKQFGHWMFRSPENLLLEQAVHPLSQIDDLLGPIGHVRATPGPIARPAEGIAIAPEWDLSLDCERGRAQVQIVLGADFPCWTLSALCDDGVIDVDYYEGRVTARGPHLHIAPIDQALRSFGVARRAARAGRRSLTGYAAELLRIGPKSDGFNRAMENAVAAFHADRAAGAPMTGLEGARLVAICREAAAAADLPKPAAAPKPAHDRYDVAVLGATGFIGQTLVAQLLAQGKTVAAMARGVDMLPGVFHDPRVGVFRGSITDPAAVKAVVARAEKVVNLAHGGASGGREAVVAAMVGGAETVAQACLEAGNERLLFASSSAAMYLGDAHEIITADTPPDAQPEARGDYSYAKVLAERAMLAMRARGLKVAILRPAVVVGEGGQMFHSALGAYNTDAHCLCWNDGRNPLPFVLVEDVADAIIRALDAPIAAIDGKAFNLAGDVRWSARRYTEELAKATGRPLRLHPESRLSLMAMEWAKYAVKKLAGRKGVPAPSSRDLRSRGMDAQYDTAQEKAILGWAPCADEARFRDRAVTVHLPKPAAAKETADETALGVLDLQAGRAAAAVRASG